MNTVATARSWKQAMWRGGLGFCPNCGQARLWSSYLKVRPDCPHCGTALHHHRADDAPPYFTILIIGHVLVPLIIMIEVAYHPAYWLQAAVWLPVLLASTLLLMPVVKGAIVGLQWALRMHGFAEDAPKP
jgi:uncharacterized protein (DUF983 family)